MDPVIYAYQALGAALATSATVLNASIPELYMQAFHQPGTPEQIQHFVVQESYFNTLYAAAGVAQPDLIARGAVFGQMLGFEAEMTQVPIVGTSAHAAV